MKHGVNFAADDLQAMTTEERSGLVAAVGQKAGGSGGDRPLAHGGGLRQHAFRIELVAPVGRLVDAPAFGR
jgi:hypothetical protein